MSVYTELTDQFPEETRNSKQNKILLLIKSMEEKQNDILKIAKKERIYELCMIMIMFSFYLLLNLFLKTTSLEYDYLDCCKSNWYPVNEHDIIIQDNPCNKNETLKGICQDYIDNQIVDADKIIDCIMIILFFILFGILIIFKVVQCFICKSKYQISHQKKLFMNEIPTLNTPLLSISARTNYSDQDNN
jgi:hypothetical protein